MRLLRLIAESGDLSSFSGLPPLFGIFLVFYYQGSTRLARVYFLLWSSINICLTLYWNAHLFRKYSGVICLSFPESGKYLLSDHDI